jgi:hypothetical protein
MMRIFTLHPIVATARLCAAMLVLISATASTVVLGAITNVVETGGDNEATDTITAKWSGNTFPVTVANEPVPGLAVNDNYTVGLFGHMAPVYVDRNARYSDHSVQATAVPPDFEIPAYLVGQQYIMSGNDNRDNANYRLDVTVDTPSTVYMLIDNRLGDPNSPNSDPPSFGPTKMQWILDQNWQPTNGGFNRFDNPAVPDEVPNDEGADNDIDQWFSVYKKEVSAGTFTLLHPDNTGQNMYGVVIASSGPPPVLGDVNGNGVGGEFPADFEPLRDNFRKAGNRSMGDLSGNGTVDFPDFREWKSVHLGMGGSLAGLDLGPFGSSIPEPSTSILLLVAGAAAAQSRVRRQNSNF